MEGGGSRTVHFVPCAGVVGVAGREVGVDPVRAGGAVTIHLIRRPHPELVVPVCT